MKGLCKKCGMESMRYGIYADNLHMLKIGVGFVFMGYIFGSWVSLGGILGFGI